jgi:hypothetical protein
MHILVGSYIHMYVWHTYMGAHMRACMPKDICVHARINTCVHVANTCVRVHSRMRASAFTHVCIQWVYAYITCVSHCCMHVCVTECPPHTHSGVYTCMHTCTCTYLWYMHACMRAAHAHAPSEGAPLSPRVSVRARSPLSVCECARDLARSLEALSRDIMREAAHDGG